MTIRPGTVYLVGAGPGDPGLLTVRGLELLRRADVVIHDRLISPPLLAEVLPGARLVDVGKVPRGAATDQTVINEILIAEARLDNVVVRLKGGDPLIFGRGWEEREACVAAGIPCEIVPGISSALAGPAAADIPVTCRGIAGSVAIVAAPVADDNRLAAIAHADTCVFLMGMHEIASLTHRLIVAGRDPNSPAAVVERATLPGQRSVRAPLHAIADVASAAGLESPAIIVIGETVSLAQSRPGPLSGKRIVVTRPTTAAHETTQRLRTLGADVIAAPLIEIALREPDDPSWFSRLASFDWVVFSSRHAVRGFRRALEAEGGDLRRLGAAQIAAVGPITGRELEQWGIRPDLIATPARADALVTQLTLRRPAPRRALFPSGTLALETIPLSLSTLDIPTERVRVYETRQLAPDPRVCDAIAQGVDAILLASPSAATALGRCGMSLHDTPIICIGPTTAAATAPYGWTDVRVADVHTDNGMIDLLLSIQPEEIVQ